MMNHSLYYFSKSVRLVVAFLLVTGCTHKVYAMEGGLGELPIDVAEPCSSPKKMALSSSQIGDMINSIGTGHEKDAENLALTGLDGEPDVAEPDLGRQACCSNRSLLPERAQRNCSQSQFFDLFDRLAQHDQDQNQATMQRWYNLFIRNNSYVQEFKEINNELRKRLKRTIVAAMALMCSLGVGMALLH